MLGFLNRSLSFYSGMKIWRIGSNSILRRLHQESITLLNEHDLKCLERNVHFFSATLSYDCPAPGQHLSSIYMPVRIVSLFCIIFLFRPEMRSVRATGMPCNWQGALRSDDSLGTHVLSVSLIIMYCTSCIPYCNVSRYIAV